MKATYLLNFMALIFVLACNFETADLPYFKGIFQEAYLGLQHQLKLLTSSFT